MCSYRKKIPLSILVSIEKIFQKHFEARQKYSVTRRIRYYATRHKVKQCTYTLQLLMYKVKHNLCPRTICDMFYANSHTYSLRQRDFSSIFINTVTYGRHSIRYLGPRLWSKLTIRERSAINLKQFKTHVQRLDLGNILDRCIAAIFVTHNFNFSYRIYLYIICNYPSDLCYLSSVFISILYLIYGFTFR